MQKSHLIRRIVNEFYLFSFAVLLLVFVVVSDFVLLLMMFPSCVPSFMFRELKLFSASGTEFSGFSVKTKCILIKKYNFIALVEIYSPSFPPLASSFSDWSTVKRSSSESDFSRSRLTWFSNAGELPLILLEAKAPTFSLSAPLESSSSLLTFRLRWSLEERNKNEDRIANFYQFSKDNHSST